MNSDLRFAFEHPQNNKTLCIREPVNGQKCESEEAEGLEGPEAFLTQLNKNQKDARISEELNEF